MFKFRNKIGRPGMNFTSTNTVDDKITKIEIKNTTIPNSNDKPDMEWGAHYWHFFHTITEKILDEEFNSKKDDLIKIIQLICVNLPCPECTEHAKTYINQVEWKNVKSKMDLKHIMYTFHNKVNSQKNFSIFTLDELETKYRSADTIAIINNFLNFFPYKGKQLMIGTFSHKINATYVRNWLKENIHCFKL